MFGKDEIIRLRGKTQKGKNIVKKFGAEWRVERFEESCICFDFHAGVFITPTLNGFDLDALVEKQKVGDPLIDARWIQFPVDKHLEVIKG